MEFEEEMGRHGVKAVIGDAALRWNHQGFKVQYTTKKDYIKVGGFYLKNLLIDKDVKKPQLEMSIENKHAREFWDKLTTEFMLQQHKQNVYILKVMILLYRDNTSYLK